MEYFFVKDGKVLWLSEEEFEALGPKHSLQEVTKDMTTEELEDFKKYRQEQFIEPLMNHNIQELKNQIDNNKSRRTTVTKRKSWMIDPDKRKK